VDRVTGRRDKENLATNLQTFHEQLVTATYGPPPVVRRLLPKSNGTLRPLGLPALEDTIVATAGARRREARYEQDFCAASYGFRPGRSPHQALHDVRQGLLSTRRSQGIDWDISAFFDTLPHDMLVAMLRKRVKDGGGLQRIEQWRHAGLLDGTERVSPDTGRPQGSVRSPLLANAYLHDVLDRWCATGVQAPCRGHVVLWR
jgi:retron-type reverse transcriptase